MVDLFHRAGLFLVSGGEKKREYVCFECMCHRVKNNSFVNAQRLACPLQEMKHDNINITHLSHYLTLLAFLRVLCDGFSAHAQYQLDFLYGRKLQLAKTGSRTAAASSSSDCALHYRLIKICENLSNIRNKSYLLYNRKL